MTSQEFISSLRELADYYESNPNTPVPTYPILNIFASNDPEIAKRQFRQFGAFDKEYLEAWFVARKKVGGITLDLCAPRDQVCQKVVTGTRTIPEHVVPASPEMLVPEKVEEIYEWQCDPVLG